MNYYVIVFMNNYGERSAMLISAENQGNAFDIVESELSKRGEILDNGECINIPKEEKDKLGIIRETYID